MKAKVVIFDVGGTLINYQGRSIREAMAGVDCPEPIAERVIEVLEKWPSISPLISCEISIPKIIERAFQDERMAISKTEFNRLVDMAFVITHTPFMLYPDVLETLAALKKKGIKLGIISNTQWPGALHARDLDHFQISHYFETMVWSHDFRFKKPCKNIFFNCLRKMNIAPDDTTIYVGNDVRDDIIGAYSAGMQSVWINRRENNPQRDLMRDLAISYWEIWDLRQLIDLV